MIVNFFSVKMVNDGFPHNLVLDTIIHESDVTSILTFYSIKHTKFDTAVL